MRLISTEMMMISPKNCFLKTKKTVWKEIRTGTLPIQQTRKRRIMELPAVSATRYGFIFANVVPIPCSVQNRK